MKKTKGIILLMMGLLLFSVSAFAGGGGQSSGSGVIELKALQQTDTSTPSTLFSENRLTGELPPGP
jgi:hypothetical protein